MTSLWGGSFGAWGPPGEGIKGEGIDNITPRSQHANGPRAGEFSFHSVLFIEYSIAMISVLQGMVCIGFMAPVPHLTDELYL